MNLIDLENDASPIILIGICSVRSNKVLREQIRKTWLASRQVGIKVCFFAGDGNGVLEEEQDTLALPLTDTYEALPAKIQAFFSEALKRTHFEWLFKCDDDTYVDLTRLHDLVSDDWDLVGNEFITKRGSPSGGAGYLLRRKFVEAIATDENIPTFGAEDILIGEAIRHGARPHATERLCWYASRFPAVWNDTITSHWCSVERMPVIHQHWKDDLFLLPDQTFRRHSTCCEGTYRESEADGFILYERELRAEFAEAARLKRLSAGVMEMSLESCRPLHQELVELPK